MRPLQTHSPGCGRRRDPAYDAASRASLQMWVRRYERGLNLKLQKAKSSGPTPCGSPTTYLQCRRRRTDQYEIHDGSGFYEEMYGYSVALFINASTSYGHHKDAEKLP